MKHILTTVFLGLYFLAGAQVEDTTIYKVVQEMPRFPGCEEMDTTMQAKNQCAQTSLLFFFNQNINYPMDARNQNLEGQVVISFVVEKDGFISNAKLLRDIGGGCGEEAIRVANGMNDALKAANIAWRPGMVKGVPVRSQVTLPIKFKLQDPPDFTLIDNRDTVYTVLDDSLAFEGGHQALLSFVQSKLQTPAAYKDSCKVGAIDVSVLSRPDGYVRVVDLTDYWSLGVDFQWEAIKAATATWGKWVSAKRKGRKVPSAYDFSVEFLPDNAACQQAISKYEKATQLADEGSAIFNEGQKEEGIAKLSEAIELFPQNANFLYLRGQAYMNMEKMDEACADFQKVRSMAIIAVVEQLAPLICNKKED